MVRISWKVATISAVTVLCVIGLAQVPVIPDAPSQPRPSPGTLAAPGTLAKDKVAPGTLASKPGAASATAEPEAEVSPTGQRDPGAGSQHHRAGDGVR